MKKLQVWNMINFNPKVDKYDVQNIEDAIKLIDNLANAQLKNSQIHDNSFSLMEYNEIEKEWEEWHDEDWNNIEDYELKDGKVVLSF